MNKYRVIFVSLILLSFFIVSVGASVIRTGVVHVDCVSGHHQHKSFYANGLYWAFYYIKVEAFDGMEVATSSDAITWDIYCTLENVTGDARQFSVDFNGTHFAYVEASEDDLKFRMGIPNANATISWIAELQTIPEAEGATPAQADVIISLDVNGYAWVGARNVSGVCTPWFFKNNETDGTWTTDFTHKAHDSDAGWGLQIIPLANGQVYIIYGTEYRGHYGKLWDGDSFGSEETIQSPDSLDIYAGSGIADGNHIFYVFTNKTNGNYRAYSTKRIFGEGWTAKTLVYDGTVYPVLSYFSPNSYVCTWVEDIDPIKIVYKQYQAGNWESDYTIVYSNDSEVMSCGEYALTGWSNVCNNQIITMFYLATPSGTLHFEVATVRHAPPTSFVDAYFMLGVGLTGIIMLIAGPTMFARTFIKHGLDTDTIQQLGYSMLMAVLGFGFTVVWLWP